MRFESAMTPSVSPMSERKERRCLIAGFFVYLMGAVMIGVGWCEFAVSNGGIALLLFAVGAVFCVVPTAIGIIRDPHV
jgi:hypothetical protein